MTSQNVTVETLNSEITLETTTQEITLNIVATGPTGAGVPTGGTTGQVLAKASNADQDTEWVAQSGGAASVTSVFGRTGAVAAQANDYQDTEIEVDDTDFRAATDNAVTGSNVHAVILSLLVNFGLTVVGIMTAIGTKFDKVTDDLDDITAGTTNKHFTSTDETKLDGIETGADVTDATNVDAAGATMNTDTSLAGNGYFLDEDDMASDSATKTPSQQSVKAYAQKRTPRGTSKVSGGTVRDYCLPGISLLDSAATSSPSSNRWNFEPYVVEEPTTFDRVGVEITTAGAAGKLMRLALYTADEYWQPLALVEDFGTIALDVGAVPTVSVITINRTLQPGRYLGVNIIDAAATFRAISAYLPGVGLSPTGTTTPFRAQFLSLNGSGTVASGFAAVSPAWERDVFFVNSGKFSYLMRWREAV